MNFDNMQNFEKPRPEWEQRIINGARKKIKDEVLNKVVELNLSDELKNDVLDAVAKKLNDDAFIQKRLEMNNWANSIADAENPEKKEDELSIGLVMAIKAKLSEEGSKNFEKIFG